MTIASRTDAPAGGRLTVDLAALAHNWRLLAAAAPTAETGAAVKADAYGLGLDPAARALWSAGCRTFFVALPSEGVALRAVLPDAIIYVLNGHFAGTAALCRRHRLQPVLGDLQEIDAWIAEVGPDGPSPAIQVDTGINRLGLTITEAAALAADRDRLAALAPSLVMSHFACADTPGHPLNQTQVERFAEIRRLFPGVRASLANSAGVALGPSAHHDLTRPGISLYGGRAREADDHPVRPVVTLEARVAQVREVAAGDGIGYGANAKAAQSRRVAILCAGYADGYHRAIGSAGAVAAVRGERVPLVGRVSMDLMAVDVTGLDPGAVGRGDFVELIGPTVPLAEVAERAGTIDYEILTSLGRRFERRYLD